MTNNTMNEETYNEITDTNKDLSDLGKFKAGAYRIKYCAIQCYKKLSGDSLSDIEHELVKNGMIAFKARTVRKIVSMMRKNPNTSKELNDAFEACTSASGLLRGYIANIAVSKAMNAETSESVSYYKMESDLKSDLKLIKDKLDIISKINSLRNDLKKLTFS